MRGEVEAHSRDGRSAAANWTAINFGEAIQFRAPSDKPIEDPVSDVDIVNR